MTARARALVLLAAAACVSAQDECPANAATCVGQTCTDPDTTTPNNWYCSCNLPAIGYPKTGAVATCVTPVGECLAGQPGATACPAGQVCVDPNAAVAGDWQCQCMAPATGAAGMQAPAASCTIDECTLPPACAGAGTAQQCNDPSQVMAGDWQCACVAPQVGYPKLAARAGCFTTNTGECAAGQPGITTCPSTALQVCVDPNVGNANDWTCNCKPPATGTMGAQAVATCTLNECEVLANAAICPSSANQACEDLNTGVLDDWQCKCTAPWTGTSVTKAVATCTLDECTVAANAAVCTAAAQTCNDPNTAVAEDWTCTCPAPATGTPVVKAAATCVLDECLTAANAQVCTAAGQTCVDPTKTLTNKEDWTCTCTAPATGAAVVKGVATCTTVVDECVANAATCPAGSQTCSDPNTSVTGDWLCTCNAPNVGQKVAAAATCVAGTDECAVAGNAAKCTGATPAQVCQDPNFGAMNDWRCACTGGLVGQPVVGGPATCVVGTDECLTAANKAVCTGATPPQECVDTNYQSLNNWECRCTGLQVGSKLVAVATCTAGTDECAVAGNAAVCPSGQTCSDPNFATADDWTCRCNAPAVGVPLVKKAAVCFVAKTVAQTSGQSMVFRAKAVMATLTRNMFTLPLREIVPAQAAQIVLMYVCPVSIVGTTYPTRKEDKARCTMARDIRASSRVADVLQATKEDVWVEFDVDAVNTASLDEARNAAYNAVAQELQKVSPDAGRLAPVEATAPLELRPSERTLADPYVAGVPGTVITSDDDGVSKVWMWLFIVAAVALCLCLVALLALLLMSKKKKGGDAADANAEAAQQQRQKQYEMQQQQQPQPQQQTQQQQQRGPGDSWDHPQAPVPGRMGGASPSPAGQPPQPPTQQKDVYEAAEAPQQTQYSSPGDDFAPQWQNGDKVDAKYGDDWFPAQVVERENGGTYTINWDDGTHSKSIPPESLRRQY